MASQTGIRVVRSNSCKGQSILEKGQKRAKGPNKNFWARKCYLGPNLWNLATKGPTWQQARSQVSRFGGAQYIFRGARFLLLLYVWNKFFWAQQNLGGHKRNLGGHCPRMPPCGYGPAWQPCAAKRLLPWLDMHLRRFVAMLLLRNKGQQ